MTEARGGTELIAGRIEALVDPLLLEDVQIIHSRVRNLDSNKKKVLVLHDLPQDPECKHLKNGGWSKFDKLVFVSHWQQQMFNMFLGVPYQAGIVIPNAIEPIPLVPKPDDVINLIYTSTPHRGLNILWSVFEALAKEYPNIRLKVFSSFELYGWGERDKPYAELFDKLKKHPQVEYHKAVSNDRIRSELQQSHIFAYPSIWSETSCLCLIEAMSAGLICVHPSLAALPETSKSITQMYPYVEELNDHAQLFYGNLREAIEHQKNLGNEALHDYRARNKEVVDRVHNLTIFKRRWENLLSTL